MQATGNATRRWFAAGFAVFLVVLGSTGSLAMGCPVAGEDTVGTVDKPAGTVVTPGAREPGDVRRTPTDPAPGPEPVVEETGPGRDPDPSDVPESVGQPVPGRE